jgi:hypothetical protein
MTSIKPPAGRSGPGSVGSAGGKPDAEAPERVGTGFREKLEGASSTGSAKPASTHDAGAAGSADPIGELAQAVRAGSLSAEQAIERLVERAATAMAHSLSEAQRAELTAVLRAAVQSDPALHDLRDALG